MSDLKAGVLVVFFVKAGATQFLGFINQSGYVVIKRLFREPGLLHSIQEFLTQSFQFMQLLVINRFQVDGHDAVFLHTYLRRPAQTKTVRPYDFVV